MSSKSRGPGVRRFWKEKASGVELDVKAIVQEYPDEVLDLVDAIREAATQEDSVAQEHMWLARAQVLKESGEDVTLGTLLRTSRQDAGLSTNDLSFRVKERGVALAPTAVDILEADRVRITNVKTPGLWQTIAEVLQIDRHRLVATIRSALSDPQTEQRFTRMERGASPANRNGFLSSELAPNQEGESTSYVNWVRTELGLPPAPADTVQ